MAKKQPAYTIDEKIHGDNHHSETRMPNEGVEKNKWSDMKRLKKVKLEGSFDKKEAVNVCCIIQLIIQHSN